jgi:6-phosphofructokinase 1
MRSATRNWEASGPLIAGIVRDRLHYKYHWAVADYLQRSARHIAAKMDVLQSYAVGKAAVELALADATR